MWDVVTDKLEKALKQQQKRNPNPGGRVLIRKLSYIDSREEQWNECGYVHQQNLFFELCTTGNLNTTVLKVILAVMNMSTSVMILFPFSLVRIRGKYLLKREQIQCTNKIEKPQERKDA